MKIKSINIRKPKNGEKAMLTSVGAGYLQGESGSLPDVDVDFQGDRRQDVKEYLESRYDKPNEKRVFSAGTLGALKMKNVFRDVAKIHGIPRKLINIVASKIEDTDISWSGLMKEAFKEKETKGKRKHIYNFIQQYPQVLSDIRYILGQPRNKGVHASAVIITPNHKDGKPAECYDFLPLRDTGGVLVSEFSGYDIDDIGLLKNDVLSLAELSKLKAMLDIVKREYGVDLSIEKVAKTKMDDPKTYYVLSKGLTQDVFQFSSDGITKFIQELKPSQFSDLIAATSLYRPASLKSGSTEKYSNYKHGLVEPVYLWGTYDILKETYGVLAYQEQLAQMAREIGGFTIAEGVRLVKLISKKKTEKIHEMKDKFMDGAIKKGCPKDDAVQIWDMIESGGSYLFNKCISGDETIQMFGAPPVLVSELYQSKCNGLLDDFKYACSCDTHGTGEIHKNIIKDVRFAGERKIYRITLSNGATLDVTSNHKNPTQRGEIVTSELIPNSDLMLTLSGIYDVEFCKVVSVEYLKTDDVYDIEMFDPYHNYVTGNGIVTCNSHATAYSIPSYIGAYIKAHYPTAFYTVALDFADDDKIIKITNEMAVNSDAKIVPPHVNTSERRLVTDYQTNEIYWSLSRISMCGGKAVDRILEDRELFGEYKDMADFINRHSFMKRVDRDVFELAKIKKPYKLYNCDLEFKTGRDARKHLEKIIEKDRDYVKVCNLLYNQTFTPEQEEYIKRVTAKGEKNPVTAAQIKNLIFSGCFDKIEGVQAVQERWVLMKDAAEIAGFELKEQDFPEDLVDKHYFWSMKQVEISGVGNVDYKRIYNNQTEYNLALKGSGTYMSFDEALDMESDGKRIMYCATISNVRIFSYKNKRTGEECEACELTLTQNRYSMMLMLWDDSFKRYKNFLTQDIDGRIIMGNGRVQYNDWQKVNGLTAFSSSKIFIL